MTWIITAVYWVIGLACVIWGGIKYINTFYGHFLIITLILPVLVALLVTFGYGNQVIAMLVTGISDA